MKKIIIPAQNLKEDTISMLFMKKEKKANLMIRKGRRNMTSRKRRIIICMQEKKSHMRATQKNKDKV